jgi:hypothetical protein
MSSIAYSTQMLHVSVADANVAIVEIADWHDSGVEGV